MRFTVVISLLVSQLGGPLSEAFSPPVTLRGRFATELAGLLGRFRKKRQVEQVRTIQNGDLLPEGDIEVLKEDETEGTVRCDIVSVKELLGTGKTLLVGMPGAFTPTCTAEHLPGYVKKAPRLKSEGGVDTIAILTTNDRYVNEEWSSQQGALSSSGLVVLSDGDGDFVRALGLADDMGFGVGVRSKRFALVLEDGTVESVVVDEGMDDCSATSAETMLKALTPDVAEEEERSSASLGVFAALSAAIIFVVTQSCGGGTSPRPESSLAPVSNRLEKVVNTKATSKSAGFSLLDEYR